MRSLKIKDLYYRKQYLKLENKLNLYTFISRALLLNQSGQKKKNLFITYKINLLKLKKKRIKTKLVRRCLFTNRSRSTLQSFKISRIYLRELISAGSLPGFKKGIW
jgi:ribosomal protein S14